MHSHREVIGEYVKDNLKAEIIKYSYGSKDDFQINFYEDDKMIAIETYVDHSLRYYEDAAENYVKGIKKV